MSKVTIVEAPGMLQAGRIPTREDREQIRIMLRNWSSVTMAAEILRLRVADVQVVAEEVYRPLLEKAWWKRPKA